MFDLVRLDLARQWFTPTLADVGELLVFFDKVYVRAPWGRLESLLHVSLDDSILLRELVEEGRIVLELDQMPLGELAWEMGLFQGALGERVEPGSLLRNVEEAFTTPPVLSSNPWVADGAERRSYASELNRMLATVHNPVTDLAKASALVDRAASRMELIATPDFLSSALAAYGADRSARMRTLLSGISIARFDVEGRDVAGFDAPGQGLSAELLEFLSQADELIDVVSGGVADSYASPEFGRWSASFTKGVLGRAAPRDDVDSFQKSVLGRSSVAAAIASGDRRFHELRPIFARREAFARAVRDRPPDASLAEAYFTEVARGSWLTHGAGRALRYSIFTGASVAASIALTAVGSIASSIALNAMDYFFLDKLVTGNACRTFVEDDLRTFAAGTGASA